jgi:hypothetical protein
MVVAFKMEKNALTLILVAVIAGALPRYIKAQHCRCATHQCCNQWGYCGTSKDHCGTGCQEGPCYTFNDVPLPTLTPEFFNGILDQADAICPGKEFYTRAAFLEVHDSFYEFGRIGSVDDSKREIVAFGCNISLSLSLSLSHTNINTRCMHAPKNQYLKPFCKLIISNIKYLLKQKPWLYNS